MGKREEHRERGVGGDREGVGADGMPTELFQMLKDDAFKVLHSVCQQIWKIQQWP